MKTKNFASAAMLLAAAAATMIGCNEGNSPTANSAAETQGINNSDIRKPSYHPPTEVEKAAATKKNEMLQKIDAEWASHLASVDVSKSAAKTATTGTIGVLGGGPSNLNSDYLDVYFDTENDGNADSLHACPTCHTNETYVIGFERLPSGTGGMQMDLYRRTLSSLPILKYDYVVVKLSDDCPTNGYSFGEVFDDEDANNHDSTRYTSIYPGWSRRDWTGTRMEFCFVPGNGTSNTATPPWEITSGSNLYEAGAFGLPNVSYSSTGRCNVDSPSALMDGEDDGWDGYFDFEGLSSDYQTRIGAILNNQYGAPSFKITWCAVAG